MQLRSSIPHCVLYATVWVTSALGVGCAAVGSNALEEDGAGQSYGNCPSGLHIECGDFDSGLICDAASFTCRRGAYVSASRAATPAVANSLHPVALTQHSANPDSEQAVVPRPQYLSDIAAINADYDKGAIDEGTWRARALVAYRHLLADLHALPLLDQASAAITGLQSNLATYGREPGFLQDIATRMGEQYRILARHDDRLKPLGRSQIRSSILESCHQKFQGLSFDDRTTGSRVLGLNTPEIESCFVYYSALLAELKRLNDRGFVDPAVLSNLEHNVSLEQAQRFVYQTSEPVKFVHLQQISAAMLVMFAALVTPELEGQALYPHLRLPIELAVEDATAGQSQVTLPLGRWAELAITSTPHVNAPASKRMEWFRQALANTLVILKDNQNAPRELLTASAVPMDKAWQLGLIMEQSGLMSVYGGYDNQSGAARGFQRIHDVLLAEAKKKEFAAPAAALATAAGCIATSVAIGFGVGGPPGALVAAGVCLAATVVGVYQYFELAELAAVAHTLAYVGLDASLIPRKEAVRLRRDANIAAAFTVLDVFMGVADVVLAVPEAIALAKSRGIERVNTAADLMRAVAEDTQPFVRQLGGQFVYSFENGEGLLHAVRDVPLQISATFGDDTVTLLQQSVAGFSRVDLLDDVFNTPGVGPLYAEALGRVGIPQFGFIESHADSAGNWVAQGGMLSIDRSTLFNARGATIEVRTSTQPAIGVFDYSPEYLPEQLAKDPSFRDTWKRQRREVLREELLHTIDFSLPGGYDNLMVAGTGSGLPPLLGDESLRIIQRLANEQGVDVDELYGAAVHFFTETRADRVQRFAFEENIPFLAQSEWFPGRQYYIDEGELEAAMVDPEWLLRHMADIREESSTGEYIRHASYDNIPHLDIFLGLLDRPDGSEMIRRLFPQELWQDVSSRSFWRLP